MAVAFAASFMLTVTAFAVTNGGTFVIENKNYFGFYNAVNNPYGFVKVNEEMFKVGVYEYSENTYMSGKSVEGALTSDNYAFTFTEAYSCDSNGGIYQSKLYNHTIVGITSVKMGGFLNLSIKSITLTPDDQRNENYVYEK